MKNKFLLLVLFVMAVLLFERCATTFQAVSASSFEETLDMITEQLGYEGYSLSGTSSETKNEVSVTGTSYSYYTGYGSAMKNNYWQYREYSYLDTANNNVSFTLKFQLKKDDKGVEYIQDLAVSNCSASQNYSTICGMNGIVKANIQDAVDHPDATVSVTDHNKVLIGVSAGALGLLLLLSLLLLI